MRTNTKPRPDRFILEIRRLPVRVTDAVPAEVEGEPGLTIGLLKGDAPTRLPPLDELAGLYVPPNERSRADVPAKLNAWGPILKTYGLPNFLPDPADDTSAALIVDPNRRPSTECFVPLVDLDLYAGMARSLSASQVADDRRDYGPLRQLLPGHRADELDDVRRQMVAGDLLRTLGAFRPSVDWRTGKWSFVAGGWWPLLVFRTLVRSPRHTDVLPCAAPDCGNPVPPERREAGRYARGKRGEHYCSDPCMWREQKRHQRRKRNRVKA